jgi:hypothetical protein
VIAAWGDDPAPIRAKRNVKKLRRDPAQAAIRFRFSLGVIAAWGDDPAPIRAKRNVKK